MIYGDIYADETFARTTKNRLEMEEKTLASSLRVWKKVECSFTRFERRRAAPSFGGEESRKERGSWDGMVLSSYYFKVKERPILGRMKSYKFDEVHKPPRLGRFQKRQYSENDARSDAPKTDTFEASETASFWSISTLIFDVNVEQLTSSRVDDLDHHEECRESVRSSSYVLQKGIERSRRKTPQCHL